MSFTTATPSIVAMASATTTSFVITMSPVTTTTSVVTVPSTTASACHILQLSSNFIKHIFTSFCILLSAILTYSTILK